MSRYKAYAEYKRSGIDWAEKLPSHWTNSKIRYMFSFDKGLTITKENLQDEGIPCVNYGEVHSRYGFEVDPAIHPLKCVSELYLTSSQKSLLSKGDFIFADTSEDVDGSGNFTQLISDGVTFAGYHTIIVRPNDRQGHRFYAYLFDSKELRTQIRHAVKGVKVFSITQAILRGIDIWLPSIGEREKIASFLDHETTKIDTLIAKQQELIKLLKEKRQAVISHAVTKGLNPNAPMRDSGVEWLGKVPAHWEITRAKFVSEVFVPQRNKPELNEVHGVAWATMDNMKNTYISEVKNYVSEEAAKFSGSRILAAGSVIASCVGNFGIASINTVDVIINQQLQAFIPRKIKAEFLREIISLSKSYFELIGTAATLVYVNQQGFENLPVIVPPISEQDKICSTILERSLKFNDLIFKCETTIGFLQERRSALISAAVTGKIDVRDERISEKEFTL